MTALVARVLARGTHGSPAFVAGLVAGALLWFTLAATGPVALASTFATVLTVVRHAGVAYLLYLAWTLWHAPVRAMDAADASPEGSRRLFLAGLAINPGNPKSIVFFLALLPTIVDLGALTLLGFAGLAALTAYVAAAARVRRLFTSPRAARLANRGSSVAIAGAAATIAAR